MPSRKTQNTARKKRTSERQLAANRANAQKCSGPKTPEGKARSRFNALKHGLCAANVCLPGEDEAEFEFRRQAYIDHYQPANLVEWDLVEDLAAARWRKNRLIDVERILLLDTILQKRPVNEQHYSGLTPDAEAAFAHRDLIDESNSLRLIDRYENRLQYNIVTTTRLLNDEQRNRPPVEDGPELIVDSDAPATPEQNTAPAPNETICENEHPEPAALPRAGKPATIIVPRPKPLAPPEPAPRHVPQTPPTSFPSPNSHPLAALPHLVANGSGH